MLLKQKRKIYFQQIVKLKKLLLKMHIECNVVGRVKGQGKQPSNELNLSDQLLQL